MRTRLSPRVTSSSATPLSFTIWINSLISSIVICKKPERSGLHHQQVFGGRRQYLAAVSGDTNSVRYANAANAFYIGAGLDRHHHTGFQPRVIFFAEARGLMYFQPESMPCRMDEQIIHS